MTEGELEVAIITAIVTMECESGVTLTTEQRMVFRAGFVFGAGHANDNAKRLVREAFKGAA